MVLNTVNYMAMRYLLVFSLFCCVCISSFAQDLDSRPPRFDLRFGAGGSILGTGDHRPTMFETEINYKLNSYLSSSASFAYGSEKNTSFGGASFTQGNLNGFVSPLRNNRKSDFRIGGGLSLYSISDFYFAESNFTQNNVEIRHYRFDSRKSIGTNIIIENTLNITSRILISAKVFTQPYLNGDINTGWQLKAGVRL